MKEMHYEARLMVIDWAGNEVDMTDEVKYCESVEEAKEEARLILKYKFIDRKSWDNKFIAIYKVVNEIDEDEDIIDNLVFEEIERMYKK